MQKSTKVEVPRWIALLGVLTMVHTGSPAVDALLRAVAEVASRVTLA